MRPFSLMLFGPTASGKTDFSLEIARALPVEIVNADVCQAYVPLTVGTAKPDWQNQPVPHHFFDVFDSPIDFSAFRYREMCSSLTASLFERARLPLFVGGSGFYLKSLFFPPKHAPVSAKKEEDGLDFLPESPWHRLARIDPERAREIHPHDLYKINRALDIWRLTGVLPSHLKPSFEPFAKNNAVIFVDRDRCDIEGRVTRRIVEMINSGWIEEVRNLSKEWRLFLEKKQFIGYGEIFSILDGSLKTQEAEEIIRFKTLQYIKRQRTFWRSFKKSLVDHNVLVEEINLSHVTAGQKTDLLSLLSEKADYQKII